MNAKAGIKSLMQGMFFCGIYRILGRSLIKQPSAKKAHVQEGIKSQELQFDAINGLWYLQCLKASKPFLRKNLVIRSTYSMALQMPTYPTHLIRFTQVHMSTFALSLLEWTSVPLTDVQTYPQQKLALQYLGYKM